MVQAATVVVDSTGDQDAAIPTDPHTSLGTITLRSAITYINTEGDATNEIDFTIPGNGPFTIIPQTNYSPLDVQVTINGYSQPHATHNTLDVGDNAHLLIELQGGTDPSTVYAGLQFNPSSTGSTVKGIAINNFLGDGITTAGTGIYVNGASVTIVGNFIGTTVDGEEALPNLTGIELFDTNGCIVGTPAPQDRNIVAGTTLRGAGISIINTASGSNLIQNNYIGTNKSGTASLPTDFGIFIDASTTTIGGDMSFEGNVIRGGISGIFLAGSTNSVVGNTIGLPASGSCLLSGNGAGITVFGSSQTIEKNTIGGCLDGIVLGSLTLFNANQIKVSQNYIGIDNRGTPWPNKRSGMVIEYVSSDIIIGDLSTELSNVISSNCFYGILLKEVVNGVTIENNYLGTDPTGEFCRPNKLDGIKIGGFLSANLQDSVISSNVISGNTHNGLLIVDANGNNVSNNIIGLDYNATCALPNGRAGVKLIGSDETIFTANTIAGNKGDGVLCVSSNGNQFQCNKIGLEGLGNGGSGVVFCNSSGNLIGTARNTIRYNDKYGVEVIENEGRSVGDSILLASIADNGKKGIELSRKNDGVPNNLQAAPVLTSAVFSGSTTTVTGTLRSIQNTSFLIDIFDNPTKPCLTEGLTPLEETTVSIGPSGETTFSITVSGAPVGSYVSATATRLYEGMPTDTSEFSESIEVVLS